MKTDQDVYARIQQRLVHECESAREIQRAMTKLAAAYNRYVDLDRSLRTRRERILNIVRVMGPDRARATMKAVKGSASAEALPTENQWREKLIPLWKAAREYLRVAGESRVGEIQGFLTWLGWQFVSRQAIESALKRHKKTFRVTTKGHERTVALR